MLHARGDRVCSHKEWGTNINPEKQRDVLDPLRREAYSPTAQETVQSIIISHISRIDLNNHTSILLFDLG